MSKEEIAALFADIDQALKGIEQHGEQQKLEPDVKADILAETKDDRRAMLQYTLNELWRALWPLFEQQKNPRLMLEAVDRLLAIMRMEADVWGLDKQPQAEYRPHVIVREAESKPAIVA
jgi:hypothetical protein